jgi:hypothetical protein
MNHAAAMWDAGVITQHQLDAHLGKSIEAICQNGYVSTSDNHSAHFVSHLLGYKFAVTCQMLGNGRAPAATLRVRDLFPKCKSVGVWSLRPAALSTCLVFITRSSTVSLVAKTMSTAPRKHLGIYMNGFIWHYSNNRRQFVKVTVSQFKHHFPPPDNAMFYGSLP